MRERGCVVELARVGTVTLVRLGLQVELARIITLLQKLPARFPESNCTSGGNVK